MEETQITESQHRNRNETRSPGVEEVAGEKTIRRRGEDVYRWKEEREKGGKGRDRERGEKGIVDERDQRNGLENRKRT